MKKIIYLSCLLAMSSSYAQKYFTKTGKTEFKASVETFEPVEATNTSTTAILNTETGDVASLLFVKAFHFKVALMEEHFNENYMDSDKFPKAKFKGKIQGFNKSELSEKSSKYKLTGTLTVKGKTKNIESEADLKMKDGKIFVSSAFDVKPSDFDIEIPSIVRKKIAEKIKILVDYELAEKK